MSWSTKIRGRIVGGCSYFLTSVSLPPFGHDVGSVAYFRTRETTSIALEV